MTNNPHKWRAPVADEPMKDGAVCAMCGALANSEGAGNCPSVVTQCSTANEAMDSAMALLLLASTSFPAPATVTCSRSQVGDRETWMVDVVDIHDSAESRAWAARAGCHVDGEAGGIRICATFGVR